jgi:hypothetical protein
MYICERAKRSKKVIDDGNLTYFIIRYRFWSRGYRSDRVDFFFFLREVDC